MGELEKVSLLLDKLCIEAFILMEQHIETKINLERSMCDGETFLAKSRYIMGQNCVSALQLPTEDSSEMDASAVLHSHKDDTAFGQRLLELEIKKKSSDPDCRIQDPLRWFGVLVPQDLHKAQVKYKQALSWCVQSVNVQTKLHETCTKIKQLKNYKIKLMMEEKQT
ncbi:coiled-coil domain-containing protein 115 [Photinus pyralis]|uniref:Vacuolar ATPase assembly protein VMA22 n=1 Tax=Photinus pyralis TaxID=7054 RepID=A0A1Y1LFF2_PHOPY|nr:coiled-coil domain-containing protein 115 [Photinus pyralis]